MSVSWVGRFVPLNRRSATGRKYIMRGKTRVLVSTIRTTDEYQAFKEDLAIQFRCLPRFEKKWVKLTLTTLSAMDIDSIYKPVQDALQMAGVIDDDFQIREHSTRAYVGKRGGENVLIVDLEELSWDPTTLKEKTGKNKPIGSTSKSTSKSDAGRAKTREKSLDGICSSTEAPSSKDGPKSSAQSKSLF